MEIIVVSHVPFTPEIGTPYHLPIALGRRCAVTVITPVLSLTQGRRVVRAARGQPVRVIAPICPTGARALPRRWRDAFRARYTQIAVGRTLRTRAARPDAIWAFFTETALWLDTRTRAGVFCYHRLDDFRAMKPSKAELDEQLMQRADWNFVVTPCLVDPQSMRPNSWTYLPNGVATELFAKAQAPTTAIPQEIARIPSPRIGYIGAIHPDWVDVELLVALAQATPQWSWVIIGPKIRWELPKNLPSNLHFLGARPYSALPNYLKGLDVCIIPFRDNPISRGASPLKLYEYLAAGKAVVSVPYFHDLHQFGDLTLTARAVDEWRDSLSVALAEANNPRRIAQRMQSVAEHSWEARAERVLQVLRRSP